MEELNQLHFLKIEKWFHKDYSYEAIIQRLSSKYGIQVSPRTFSRILQQQKLRRKNILESSEEEIVLAILLELQGSGFNLGYRAMSKRI